VTALNSGYEELLMWPVELIQRGGKPAGALAIVVGLALVPCGVWLAFGLPAPDDYMPIMLNVSVIGLGLAVAGLASFVGTRAKLANFDPGAESASVPPASVMSAQIPFWVCSGCEIVREGVSVARRCERCGSVADYMEVECEDDRKLAAGLLSP
jgi:hypothetical protein